MENKIDISIILPCYNEAQVLKSSIAAIREFMDKTVYQYEIIIAEDASTDGTDKIAKELSDSFDNILWLHRDERVGRGSAVANGIKKARGRMAGFLDTDLEISPDHIPSLALAIDHGADIAVGVRNLQLRWFDVFLKLPKIVTHYGYIWISQKLLGVKLKDTESGCKFFNRKRILPILDEVKDQHWFWDTEIMIRPYLKGYRIDELPVLFYQKYERASKVDLIKDSISHFKNLLEFRKEIKAVELNAAEQL